MILIILAAIGGLALAAMLVSGLLILALARSDRHRHPLPARPVAGAELGGSYRLTKRPEPRVIREAEEILRSVER